MTSAMSTHHGLISGSIGFVSRAAIQLCVLGVTIMATRYLAIAAFGAYTIAAALMLLSRSLFYVGPYEYLLKTPDTPRLKGSCFVANLILAFASSLVLVVLSSLSTSVFGTSLVGTMLLYLVPSLFFAAVTAWHEALLLRKQAVRSYYLFTVLGESASAIAAIACLVSGVGLLSLVVQVYVRLGCLLLLYLVGAGERSWRSFSLADARRIIGWSWSRYSSVFVNFMSDYGADFILGALLSPAATGIYRASNRIVSALTDLFAQPLLKIVQTNVSARAARGLAPDTSWLGMFTGVAAIGWAALAALAFAADDLVPLILGEKWRVTTPLVIIFCAARAFSLLDATTTSLLVSCDRQRFMLAAQIGAATLVLLASAALASFGPGIVAVATGAIIGGAEPPLCVGSGALVGGKRPRADPRPCGRADAGIGRRRRGAAAGRVRAGKQHRQ